MQIAFFCLSYSDVVVHDEVNIDEIPHISIAPLLQKKSTCSSEDYSCSPNAIATNYKLSTNSDDSNDPFDSETSSISHNAVLLAMKRSLSFSGRDTLRTQPRTLPLPTGTLPRLSKKKNTYVSEIDQHLNISKPTSTRVSKPLPLLPFESFDNGDRFLNHKNKHRRSLSNTEDNVIAEHRDNSCILDEDSNPYETVKLRCKDEELEESLLSLPLANGVDTAVNNGTVSNHYVSMSLTASTTKQEDLTSPLLPLK